MGLETDDVCDQRPLQVLVVYYKSLLRNAVRDGHMAGHSEMIECGKVEM